MAPMPFDHLHSLKRNSTTADFDAPAAKKQNRGPWRHHRPTWLPTGADRNQPAPQDGESMDALLERAITLALEAIGFSGADPHAIEAFRLEVEEYMLHFLGDVRQSMLVSKRARPVPADFLQSLHTHQLQLTSLLPHLNPPVPPEKSQITLSSESPLPTTEEEQIALALTLKDDADEGTRHYIPSHFPAFPSAHTYKATAELPSVEREPRKVRELAIEEARLGEAALRRLVGARSDMNTSNDPEPGKGVKSRRAKRDDIWKEAMQAATSVGNDMMDIDKTMPGYGGHEQVAAGSGAFLSTSVNAGKQYWRKPAVRRPVKSSTQGATI